MTIVTAELIRHIEGERFRIEHPLAVNVKDGSVLVYVPAGAFEMGDGQESNCPKHRVELSAYWIGVGCVTNAQYLRFVAATQHRAPDNPRHLEAAYAEHPVTNVSWDDAVAYAAWAGCRLPTEAEWEKAARGPMGLIYPWGDAWTSPTRLCRHGKNRGNETTAPVYGYPVGVSGYGTYQQSGNVWEWCADWYGEKYYGTSPPQDPTGPKEGALRVYRGGCWWDVDASYFRGAIRFRDDPAYRYDILGFRLVRAAA